MFRDRDGVLISFKVKFVKTHFVSSLRGFTLLELMVVLALVAIVTGLAAPNVARWLDNARERAWRSDLRATLAALPVRAHAQGSPLNWDEKALRSAVPSLPGNAKIELAEPLRYAATGLASANELRVQFPGQPAETWRIEALTGAVVMSPAEAGAWRR